MRCTSTHPKLAFFIFFFLCIAVVGGIIGAVLASYFDSSNCAYNEAFYRYYLVQFLVYFFVSVITLCFPFYGAMRYTNSPGNFAWPIVFSSFAWMFTGMGDIITLIGILVGLCLLVSILSLVSTLLVACSGVTTDSKKGIVVFWVIELILMVLAEGMATYLYLEYDAESVTFGYYQASSLALVCCFLLGNAVDLIFWLVGLLTLRLEHGDKVRDELLQFGKNKEWEDEISNDQEYQPKYRDVNP